MHRLVGILLLAALALAGRPALAQLPADTVPYIPTPTPVVSAMLSLGRVGPGDTVYDLGSGDGRIVITAARELGARGVGFEIDPRLVRRSRANAAAAGVDGRVQFVEQDLFAADLGPASVVMLYLSPRINVELRPKLLRELAPGARVVSHTFHMGDWAPDSVVQIGEGFGRTTIRLWTVPANLDGFWQLTLETPRGEQRYVLEIQQRYQEIRGAIRDQRRELPLAEGKVTGERVDFTLPDGPGERALHFTGRWTGAALQGRYTAPGSSASLRWRAVRFSAP